MFISLLLKIQLDKKNLDFTSFKKKSSLKCFIKSELIQKEVFLRKKIYSANEKNLITQLE